LIKQIISADIIFLLSFCQTVSWFGKRYES
jgi:hypothetical protein